MAKKPYFLHIVSMGELPLYDLQISLEDETGVEFISLVDQPAIQLDWQAFKNVNQPNISLARKQAFKKFRETFKVENEEKRIIAGFAMISDLEIYRRDESGEYNVKFSKETISKIVQKFFKHKGKGIANVMHTDLIAEDTYLIESFQIDTARGILTPKGYDTQPDGSWYVAMKVDSDKLWNDFIKTGDFKGFSIEGVFEHVREFNKVNMNSKTEQFFNKMKEFFTDNDEVETTEEVVEVPTETEVEMESEEVALGEAALASGTIIMWDGELEIGTAIRVVTEEGEVSAEDGDHELADGSGVIRTEGGMVTEIIEAEVMNVEEVVEELMRDLGIEMKALKNEVKEAKAETTKVRKEFTEFKEQTEKDLEAKNEKIVELSKVEVAKPVQKTANRPAWALNRNN